MGDEKTEYYLKKYMYAYFFMYFFETSNQNLVYPIPSSENPSMIRVNG
jgi:hypothetical protein